MKTGLHISTRKFLLSLLVVVVIALSTAFGPAALYEATGVQVGAPLYACSGHSSSGGDC